METWDPRPLLDRIRGVHTACDLDMLSFFYRHPRALLTSEQLVSYLGYDQDRVARTLEGLIEAGLLTRSQNPAHATRLYVLEFRGSQGGALESLLKIASTREGRRAVMLLLNSESEPTSSRSGARALSLARVA